VAEIDGLASLDEALIDLARTVEVEVPKEIAQPTFVGEKWWRVRYAWNERFTERDPVYPARLVVRHREASPHPDVVAGHSEALKA
jgi:hypothetical protein